MKLGPVIKLGKRNRITSKKNNEAAMSANCDHFSDFLPIWKNPEARFQTNSL